MDECYWPGNSCLLIDQALFDLLNISIITMCSEKFNSSYPLVRIVLITIESKF